MLTDAELRNTRGKSKAYKKTDRDGLYVLVTPSGGIAFKYDYRFNGRRETVTRALATVSGCASTCCAPSRSRTTLTAS